MEAARHHHGDRDGAQAATDAPAVPFNAYLQRMLRDVENVGYLCDVLERAAGELSPADARALDARLASARAFMRSLAAMPNMVTLLSPDEAKAAQRAAQRGER